MTHPPKDQPAIWLKQVPNNDIHAEGVWSQSLLPGHHVVARRRWRPTATVDAVALQELKVAVAEVIYVAGDMDLPEFRRLRDALFDMHTQ